MSFCSLSLFSKSISISSKIFFLTLGWDNTDKFFKDDTPAQQFSDQLKQIPPDLQNQVVGYFEQQLQQITQQYQQQQQQAQMQAQANEQVEMDMLRQQARQQAENKLLNNQLI